jgi:hypothetical protein
VVTKLLMTLRLLLSRLGALLDEGVDRRPWHFPAAADLQCAQLAGVHQGPRRRVVDAQHGGDLAQVEKE